MLSQLNWADLFAELGKAAVVLAVVGYFGKLVLEQYLKRNIQAYENELRRKSTQEFKELELRLTEHVALAERARERRERWFVPLLGATRDLQERLANVLDKGAYSALSPSYVRQGDWSMNHRYFLASTVYLFGQYFCWSRIVENRLTLDVLGDAAARDGFLELIRKVRATLSTFPMADLKDRFPHAHLPAGNSGGDAQVFALQQRAMGEAMQTGSDDAPRCLTFVEFCRRWEKGAPDEDSVRDLFAPLEAVVSEVRPDGPRWSRLTLMRQALAELRSECERVAVARGGTA